MATDVSLDKKKMIWARRYFSSEQVCVDALPVKIKKQKKNIKVISS